MSALVNFAVLWGILFRFLTSNSSYSGAGKPPMFGDFEAQRHWMEITTNLPPNQWYVNSTENDLLYWGLDYPPLTAYHSWLCGKISGMINPSWTALNSSRGFESEDHKLFMRYSVLISDLLVYFPAVYYFSTSSSNAYDRGSTAFAMLLNPALVVIDHGHFQYNCVCLGLFVLFVAFVKKDKYFLASVAFCLCLNFKQIALYYSIPVFLHLLKQCVSPLNPKRFLILASGVLLTFGVLWSPFVFAGFDNVLQVLKRLFPFNRGLFEDKVANFWCVSNVIVKYGQLFDQNQMAKISLAATVFFSLPSWLMLLKQSTEKIRSNMNFKLALFNTSMAFYLFSYQVHEKSILFPLMALHLISSSYPELLLFFTNIACFSMAPLLSKDGCLLACLVLVVQNTILINKSHFEDSPQRRWNSLYLLRIVFCVSMVGCAFITVLENFADPPKKYPQLFTLFNCAFSLVHFLAFFIYGNMLQFRYVGDIRHSQKEK